MAAALMPRVWALIVCDRARASREEDEVYNLRGARNFLVADHFPFRPRSLRVYLVLSSPRTGKFPASCKIIHERTEKTVFIRKFTPELSEPNRLRSFVEPINCTFPEAGLYTVQVSFYQEDRADVLKGEVPFPVLAEES
jgi:hypothetical protein